MYPNMISDRFWHAASKFCELIRFNRGSEPLDESIKIQPSAFSAIAVRIFSECSKIGINIDFCLHMLFIRPCRDLGLGFAKGRASRVRVYMSMRDALTTCPPASAGSEIRNCFFRELGTSEYVDLSLGDRQGRMPSRYGQALSLLAITVLTLSALARVPRRSTQRQN